MTPRWCTLYRISYDDGRSADCSGRSWAETTEKAANELRNLPLGPHESVSLEVVAVIPWAVEHYTRTTVELFADLKDDRDGLRAERVGRGDVRGFVG